MSKSDQLKTQFKFIVPFKYDENKFEQIKNDTENDYKEVLDKVLDNDFLHYVKNFFGKSHFTQNIDKFIIIENKDKLHTIKLKNIDYYFFKEKALCVFNYIASKLDEDKILFFTSRLGSMTKKEPIFLENKRNITIEKDWQYNDKFKKFNSLKLYKDNNNIKVSLSLNKSTMPLYCVEENIVNSLSDELNLNRDICTTLFKETVIKYSCLNDFITSVINPFTKDEFILEKENLYLNLLVNYNFTNKNLKNKILIRRMSNNQNEDYGEKINKLSYFNIDIYSNEKTSLIVQENGKYTDFFSRYNSKFFYIYLISIYQSVMAQDTINKAIIELNHNDYKKIKYIKQSVLYFLANINFSKIINDQNGTNIYEFYRKNLKTDIMTHEIKDNITLISSFLEQFELEEQRNRERNKEKYIKFISYFVAIVGIFTTILDVADKWKVVLKLKQSILALF